MNTHGTTPERVSACGKHHCACSVCAAKHRATCADCRAARWTEKDDRDMKEGDDE